MIQINNLNKTYRLGTENSVKALDNINLNIEDSEIAVVVGPSGSGKSTLLNILGGLDREYDGEVIVGGKDIKKRNPNEYRRNWVQTIFQQFYLVPALNVRENATLPITFGKQFSGKEFSERVDYILNTVGLYERKNHKPSELSGGQIQRVAVARALITDPKIILADEPTGNLDSKTGNEIVELFYKINEEQGTTMVIITHNTDIFKNVSNKVFMRDGQIVESK